jgi:hypothetical protein
MSMTCIQLKVRMILPPQAFIPPLVSDFTQTLSGTSMRMEISEYYTRYTPPKLVLLT